MNIDLFVRRPIFGHHEFMSCVCCTHGALIARLFTSAKTKGAKISIITPLIVSNWFEKNKKIYMYLKCTVRK